MPHYVAKSNLYLYSFVLPTLYELKKLECLFVHYIPALMMKSARDTQS